MRCATGSLALLLMLTSACAQSESDDAKLVGWKHHFGTGSMPTQVRSVSVSPEGNLILAGNHAGPLEFGNDVALKEGDWWEIAFVTAFDASGVPLWVFASQQNDSAGVYDSADATAVDSDGNVFVAGGGRFPGLGELGLKRGGFVSKLSRTGQRVWDTRILPQDPNWDLYGFGIGVVPANAGGAVVAVECAFSPQIDDVVIDMPDILAGGIGYRWLGVFSLDADGHALWGRRLTSLFSIGGPRPALTADRSGNIYLAVSSQFAVDLGEGPIPTTGEHAVTVVALGPAGNLLWHRSFSGSDTEVGSLGVDESGNLVLLMIAGGDVDLGGVTLGGGPYDLRAVLLWLDRDGAVLNRRSFPTTSRLDTLAVGSKGLVMLGTHSGNDYGQTLVVQCNADATDCRSADLGESWQFYRNVAWHPDGDFVGAGTFMRENPDTSELYAAIGKLRFE